MVCPASSNRHHGAYSSSSSPSPFLSLPPLLSHMLLPSPTSSSAAVASIMTLQRASPPLVLPTTRQQCGNTNIARGRARAVAAHKDSWRAAPEQCTRVPIDDGQVDGGVRGRSIKGEFSFDSPFLLSLGAARALASARSALLCAHLLSKGQGEAVLPWYCLFLHFCLFFPLFAAFSAACRPACLTQPHACISARMRLILQPFPME